MTNIGQDVTIPIRVTVAGTLTDPASVDVEVTPPSGAVQTPTATRLSTGLYEAVVTASLADRWFYTVTTTDPDSVEHGHFDVSADPPPPDRLMPLATVADLEDRATLTDAQRTHAPALLRDASAKIRGYCKQTFDLTEDDEVVLRPVGTILRLPQRPVLAVTQVEQIGAAGTADRVMSAGEWAWDGVDKIELWPDPYRQQALPAGTGYYTDTYRPRYDHGYAVTPDNLVALTCDMVLRVLLATTQVAGLRSETIGSYSYSLAGDGALGTKVTLTEDDKKELRDAGYRRTATTVQLRV